MTSPYQKELELGLLAVQRAALLTKTVLASVDKGAQTKDDNSPVTVADLGAQALLISAIHHNFPNDEFIGEESSETLRQDKSLCDRVWDLVRTTCSECQETQHLLGTISSEEEMLDAIDRGCGRGGNSGRIWMLDPIDGTKAFMNGGQYVVALALIEDGEQRVGILGCPNLSLERFGDEVSDVSAATGGEGVVISAVRGQGAHMRPLSLSRPGVLSPESKARRISKPSRRSGQPIQFVESTQSRSSDLEAHRGVAEKIGSNWPGTEVFAIQMRYVAMAAGHCDVMIRIPSDNMHREMAWDHAGGVLVLQEAGGKVQDLDGNPIDFGAGRKLQANHGIVAAMDDVHAQVLETAQGILRDGLKPC
ncbi:hypothetical protein RBB50_002529 [Rhinocladiella similis]